MRMLIRNWTILGLMALVLSVCTSTAYAQKGGGVRRRRWRKWRWRRRRWQDDKSVHRELGRRRSYRRARPL